MKTKYWGPLLSLALLGCSAQTEPSGEQPPLEPLGETLSPLRLAPFDNCSTSQKANLRGAERLALYITRPYIVEWVTEPRGNKPHYLVDKFFDRDGVWDERTTAHVRSRMAGIHDRLAEGDVTVRCRDTLPCRKETVHAYVRPYVPGDKITFCDFYFESSPDDNAGTWAHELSHELFDTKDLVSETQVYLLTSEAARKTSYLATESYVNGGGNNSATQEGGFVHALIGEFFAAWYRSVGKGDITERELRQAILDVQHELNPLYRIRDEVDWCWDGDTTSTACLGPMKGRHRRVCEAAEWKTVETCQSECPSGSRCCERVGGSCRSCVATDQECR